MSEADINTFYVAERISKIRWVPENYGDPRMFVTGSWNNSKNNTIKLWNLVKNSYYQTDKEFVPKCVDKLKIEGDVTDMMNINAENFIISSSKGEVRLLNMQEDYQGKHKIIEKNKLSALHKNMFKKPVSCTGVSVLNNDVATIGEDGRVNIFDLTKFKVYNQYEYTDNCYLTTVLYVSQNELLIANRMGLIKILDSRLKDQDTDLLVSFENECKTNYATKLCCHPTQKHIVFAGTEEGSVTVWDLRQPSYPASYFSAHSNSITEIGFDLSDYSKLFTAAENGELWLWNQNNIFDVSKQINQSNADSSFETNPWLNGDKAKLSVNVMSIISNVGKAINSFDAFCSKVIFSCDNEAVYYVNNLF